MRWMVRRVAQRLAPEWVDRLVLGEYARQWVRPAGLEGKDRETFVPDARLGEAGLEMDADRQLDKLREWTAYGDLFAELRRDPQINRWALGEPYLHNGFFGTPDAEVYAAMILDAQPRLIVEVGAGFSTLIARRAVTAMGTPCHLTAIDPAPRTAVEAAADTVLRRPVETIPLADFPRADRTLLFIDGSHITRSGGDIPYLYNRLLPRLPPGTLIHADDIYLPYDYPPRYQARLYTEQYVLAALLAHSTRFRVVFATHYMVRRFPQAMQEALGPIVGQDDRYFGASLWFTVV